MAKRSWVKALVIGLVSICLVAVGVLVWVWYTSNYKEYFTMRLRPDKFERVFGCTVEEIFSEDLGELGLPEDFIDHAWIDETGELVVMLDKEQQQLFRESPFLDKEEMCKGMGFTITPDNKQITVKTWAEWASWDVYESVKVINKMCILQMLDGVPLEDVAITYILKDSGTDEILLTTVWPEYPLEIDVKDYNFTKFNK